MKTLYAIMIIVWSFFAVGCADDKGGHVAQLPTQQLDKIASHVPSNQTSGSSNPRNPGVIHKVPGIYEIRNDGTETYYSSSVGIPKMNRTSQNQ